MYIVLWIVCITDQLSISGKPEVKNKLKNPVCYMEVTNYNLIKNSNCICVLWKCHNFSTNGRVMAFFMCSPKRIVVHHFFQLINCCSVLSVLFTNNVTSKIKIGLCSGTHFFSSIIAGSVKDVWRNPNCLQPYYELHTRCTVLKSWFLVCIFHLLLQYKPFVWST